MKQSSHTQTYKYCFSPIQNVEVWTNKSKQMMTFCEMCPNDNQSHGSLKALALFNQHNVYVKTFMIPNE